MSDLSTSVPHLMVPFQLGPGGAAATVEQDTIEEIQQSVAVLLGTRIGTRTVVPTYGVEDLTFSYIDPADITDAVEEWEPRAAVDVTVAPADSGQFKVTVAVSLAEENG